MSFPVFLSLGSNWGKREFYLNKACSLLGEEGVTITTKSSIYITSPKGFRFQPSFLNQVVQGRTSLTVRQLLDAVGGIERRMGRFRTFPNAPRRIDIDILFHNNQVMQTPTLTIPHPRLADRGFVLVPLAEIAPDLLHPSLDLTVTEMLAKVGREGVRRWR